MANYDDFDLEFTFPSTNSNSDGGAEPRSGWGCIFTDITELITDIITNSGCPVSDGCTSGTCSDCHSYCGGACRR